MDKMKLKHKEGLLEDLCMLECVVNELVEGYNELRERLNKRDEGIHEMVKRIKHDLYGDKEGLEK